MKQTSRISLSAVPWWCLWCVVGCQALVNRAGSSWNGYQFHTYPHPAKKTMVPRDIMVDVTNRLGLDLLAIHNEYNENNIAISPYGALSVLIALGEGLQGDAVQEIQNAAHIPNDISVIRIGLRDIHRHLKSYFIPREGFLAGLTLNHENVTLRPEYEEILKFYGYDAPTFNNALYPEPLPTEKPSLINIPETTSESPPSTTPQSITTAVPLSSGEKTTQVITTVSGDARELDKVTETSTQSSITTTPETIMTLQPAFMIATTTKEPASTTLEPVVTTTTTLEPVVTTTTTLEPVVTTTTTLEPVVTTTTTLEPVVTTTTTATTSRTPETTTVLPTSMTTPQAEVTLGLGTTSPESVTTIETATTTLEHATIESEPVNTTTVSASTRLEPEVTETSSNKPESVTTILIPVTTDQQPFTTTLKIADLTPIIPEQLTTTQVSVSTTSESPTTTLEPLVTTSEPVATTLQPLTTTLEALTTTLESLPTTSEPLATNSEPITTTLQPLTTTSKPLTTTLEPLPITSEPPSITSESVTTTKTAVTTQERPSDTTVPPTTTLPPSITTLEQVITTLEPIILTTGSVSTTLEPEVMTTEPINTTVEPAVVTTLEPVPTTPEPVFTKLEPVLTTIESLVTTQGPVTIDALATADPVNTPLEEETSTLASTTTSLAVAEPKTVVIVEDESEYTPTEAVSTTTAEDSEVILANSSSATTSILNEPPETTQENIIDNEILTNDVENSGLGFAGSSKRRARSQFNVIELNRWRGKHATTLKRKIRSVVDYVMARYYDDHHSPVNFHRPFMGEEKPSFLVQGKYREYRINFMKYDTVLPFVYVIYLDAVALSFPLDSTRYYLLLLLPRDETGVDKLICDLRRSGSLRPIVDNLRYGRVIATIPSFMLKGYVTLTPSFQQIGIKRVFEPRQSDFSPMTDQEGIFVKNIEQAITVNIKNYVDPNKLVTNRRLQQDGPMEFKADHPFLYFVMDSELHIVLMQGKIVNPLNSRIR